MEIIKFEDTKKKDERDKKKKSLLKILEHSYETDSTQLKLPEYLRTRSDRYEGPLFRFVPITYLPHGKWGEVRGEYHLFQHSIMIGIGPPAGRVEETENHEEVHSYGPEFRNELLTERVSSRSDFRKYAPTA